MNGTKNKLPSIEPATLITSFGFIMSEEAFTFVVDPFCLFYQHKLLI